MMSVKVEDYDGYAPCSLPGEWREWRVHGDTVNFFLILSFFLFFFEYFVHNRFFLFNARSHGQIFILSALLIISFNHHRGQCTPLHEDTVNFSSTALIISSNHHGHRQYHHTIIDIDIAGEFHQDLPDKQSSRHSFEGRQLLHLGHRSGDISIIHCTMYIEHHTCDISTHFAKYYRAWSSMLQPVSKGALWQRAPFAQFSRNKRFLAFLSSMWNIQWSILSTYYIYPLDIFVCTYHYMIHWCRSWRKVRSRWKRTTTLSRSLSQSRSWRKKMVSYYFVIVFWFNWQQVLKNSTWNGRLGKLHDDVMIIVW